MQSFLSHSTEKFRWGTLRCIRKFRVSKIFMHQREGYRVSPSKILCPTVPKNFVRNLFRKFLVWKKVWIREGISRFSVEIFWSHSSEKFRGRPFNVSENLGYRKIFMHNRGYHVFPWKIFVLTVPKNFVKEPFSVSLISGIKKCWV